MEHTSCGHLDCGLTIPAPHAAIGNAAPDVLLEVMQVPKRRQSPPAKQSLSVAADSDCQQCLQEAKVDGRQGLPLFIYKLWL